MTVFRSSLDLHLGQGSLRWFAHWGVLQVGQVPSEIVNGGHGQYAHGDNGNGVGSALLISSNFCFSLSFSFARAVISGVNVRL